MSPPLTSARLAHAAVTKFAVDGTRTAGTHVFNEADTCRKLVRPMVEVTGWDDACHHFYSEQIHFTNGRIVTPGGKPRRLKRKVADFFLRFTRGITLAVVEAKSDFRSAGDGLQQPRVRLDPRPEVRLRHHRQGRRRVRRLHPRRATDREVTHPGRTVTSYRGSLGISVATGEHPPDLFATCSRTRNPATTLEI